MVSWLVELFRELDSATIRVEALEFLGTLYPVGIIAGLVEVRAITKSPRVRMKIGIYSRPSAGWIALFTLPAFASLWLFADAVIKQSDIRGGSAVFVVFAGTLLFAGLATGVVELVWVAFAEDAKGTAAQRSAASMPPREGSKSQASTKNRSPNKRNKRRRGKKSN